MNAYSYEQEPGERSHGLLSYPEFADIAHVIHVVDLYPDRINHLDNAAVVQQLAVHPDGDRRLRQHRNEEVLVLSEYLVLWGVQVDPSSETSFYRKDRHSSTF